MYIEEKHLNISLSISFSGENTSELERIMKERLVKGGKFPDWFNFDKEGASILGKVISFRDHPINKNTKVATIKALDGKEYSVSLVTVLERLFMDQEVKTGDYVYIIYEGTGKSKTGRKVKLFSLAKMTADEAEKYLKEAPKIPAAQEVKPVAQEKPSPEARTPEVKPTVGIPPEKASEIKEFFSRLFEFYDEGLTTEQFKERVNKRFSGVNFEDVVKICDFLIFDESVKRFKKKE
jgi:hypothetical protein